MDKAPITIVAAVSVVLSLGFRGCESDECIMPLALNDATRNWAVGEGGNLVKLIQSGGTSGRVRGQECSFDPQGVTTKDLNSVQDYDEPLLETILGSGLQDTILCVVGDSGTVLWTTDNGNTWEDRSIPSLTQSLYGFDFVDRGSDGLHVVVCGDSGVVYASTNTRGTWNWVALPTPTTQRLTSIGAITPELIIAVGRRGAIIRTTNGGQTWEDTSVRDTIAHFNRIYLGKHHGLPNFAWAVGDNGRIYLTYLAGQFWVRLPSGTSEHLYDIAFRNEDEAVVAGAHGAVRYSTNGGFAWLEDPFLSGLTTGDILSIIPVDGYTARALIRGGTSTSRLGQSIRIMTVWTDPPTDVRGARQLPAAFRLEQNYPNPFNPATTIRFEVPVTGYVSLTIYDLSGQEVERILAGEVNAGWHGVQWDAGGLPSGVYFYRLVAKSFVETRKMLFIR